MTVLIVGMSLLLYCIVSLVVHTSLSSSALSVLFWEAGSSEFSPSKTLPGWRYHGMNHGN